MWIDSIGEIMFYNYRLVFSNMLVFLSEFRGVLFFEVVDNYYQISFVLVIKFSLDLIFENIGYFMVQLVFCFVNWDLYFSQFF